MKTKLISSPMNYIGGKYKLLTQILPLFPGNIDTFVDLFCGGASVGINVQANKIILNDNLTYLIDLYATFIKMDINEIITHIENRITEFNLSLTNQDGYLKIRELYNNQRNPLDLFVLVSFSFNHQIRFNNSHLFNCPFGKNRSRYNSRIKNNLTDFILYLKNKNVILSKYNFDEFDFSHLGHNDFIYADPPYLITTGSYNDGKRGFTGWCKTSEIQLLNLLTELDKKGLKFGLSNVLFHKGKYNTILSSWAKQNNYHISYLDKDYSNCNYQLHDKSKNSSIEVLITNYAPKQMN